MSRTVLIIDDSLTVRMDLTEAFVEAGFQTCLASSLSEARALLDQRPIDAITLDVMLPDGSGVDLLRELRSVEEHASTVVLMLSSEAEVRDRIAGLKTGADEYVGKPYDRAYVVSKCQELLRNRAGVAGALPRILVVDDSATLRAQLEHILAGAGYDVLLAESGEEGLQVAGRDRPDAIIIDRVLPGIDGPSTIRRIRLDAVLRQTPCLLLTGSNIQDAELKAFEAGADGFLEKGAGPELVLAKLDSILRGTQAAIAAEKTASLFTSKKILVVSSSSKHRELLFKSIADERHQVLSASSGRDAIDLLAVDQAIDCILLDGALADASARDICRRIKSAPIVRDIPLLMLIEREKQDLIIEELAAGADDVIALGASDEVLRARVKAQLRRKQSDSENRAVREELLIKELEAREARAQQQVLEARAALVDEVERKNKELEAFSYSVSHDLRGPLRSVTFLAQALRDDYWERLDETGNRYLGQLLLAAEKMDDLIATLLALSHVSHVPLEREPVDLSALAEEIIDKLRAEDPGRAVKVNIEQGLRATGDRALLHIAFENLLSNAWKYTAKTAEPAIEFFRLDGPDAPYCIRDNGAGFDMSKSERLFAPFQRLHAREDFEGTGVGLFNVQRVIQRHGGTIRAEGKPGAGAAFYFTLGSYNGEKNE